VVYALLSTVGVLVLLVVVFKPFPFFGHSSQQFVAANGGRSGSL
jgi:hypothetical protein